MHVYHDFFVEVLANHTPLVVNKCEKEILAYFNQSGIVLLHRVCLSANAF